MEQLTYRMLHVQLVVSNKIKSVSGDSSHLCQDVCDGTTNVPNAARTACGEYYDKIRLWRFVLPVSGCL